MTMTHRNSGVVNIINNGKVKWNGHFAGKKEHETPYPHAGRTGKHSSHSFYNLFTVQKQDKTLLSTLCFLSCSDSMNDPTLKM